MSHIATEEWQSFELRMRRRRAERMLLRAQAALDSGCLDEARTALDEARRLAPTLPSLDDVEASIARAAEPAVAAPASGRAHRRLAIAAAVTMFAAAGAISWQFARPYGSHATTSAHRAAALSTAGITKSPAQPSPPAAREVPAQPSSSIRVETEQVPPVIVSGSEAPADPAAEHAAPPPLPTKSAAAITPQPISASESDSRAVGTTGSPASASTPTSEPDVSTTAGAGITAPVGEATAIAPPEPPPEHVARVTDVPPAVSEAAGVPHPDRTAAAPPPVPKGPDDVALVRGILDKYADAYTRLDADAAKAVWPSVNRAALSRAFNGLNEQRIAFSDCAVLVHSTLARATCSGSTTWAPKIGGGARTDTRRWAFDLEKSGDDWIIRDVRVQNR
jgi:hypothetical protein